MKAFYNMSIEETLKKLETSQKGYSEVESRILEDGKNILKEKNKKNPVKIFFSQFANMMILLLLLVGAVSLVYSIVNGESIIDAIVIFSCIIINPTNLRRNKDKRK